MYLLKKQKYKYKSFECFFFYSKNRKHININLLNFCYQRIDLHVQGCGCSYFSKYFSCRNESK